MYFPCDKHAEYCDEVGNASVWSVGIHNRLRWLTATMARREKKTFMVKVEKYWRAHKGAEGRGVMCLSCFVLCSVAFPRCATPQPAPCGMEHRPKNLNVWDLSLCGVFYVCWWLM